MRDHLLYDRIESLLSPAEATLLPFPEDGVFARELSAATVADLRAMAAIVVLASPEAAQSWRVQMQLYKASEFGRPGCLLLYPHVDPPAWAQGGTWTIPLDGFKDSGPGLPPGTDERQLLSASRFAGRSLSALLAFVRTVRAGTSPPLPPIPRPSAARWISMLGV